MTPRPAHDPDLRTFVGRVGAEIRRRRLRRRLSLKDAAAKIGVPAPTWYAWEAGRYGPPLARLPAIATALGCPVRSLVPEK